ncbi:hypothetical protein LSTR_LSTR009962 [Laodelphax striatellus]|uniref:Cyclin N-terminal domain-containing protein n=1 Tax=Laodelphax striatellus TaxID=195883 RepID=A0A482XIT0_LAOST|nr:hypothetical protein LSTR_LSTR009962 [Laodelphax striatellus]
MILTIAFRYFGDKSMNDSHSNLMLRRTGAQLVSFGSVNCQNKCLEITDPHHSSHQSPGRDRTESLGDGRLKEMLNDFVNNMKQPGLRHSERPVGSAVVSSEGPFLGCDWQRWQQQQHCGDSGNKWCADVTGMDLAQLAPRPEAPDALLTHIVLEQKYQPHLKLPTHSQKCSGEVTVGIRNGSAHVLRCLKVWYDMPSEVLFVALNVMDRFLTRMKVKPKHMACISVSSFQLACKVVCDCEPLDVAVISQCKCSVGDLTRMQAIIATKLGLQVEGGGTPTTALTFLRLFHAACLNHHDRLYQRLVGEGDDMWQRLEIVMCDAVCANFRACEVALVVLCCQMDTAVSQLQPAASSSDVLSLVAFVSHLQVACNISEASFSACHEAVLTVVAQYNGETQMPHRQRLVWRVSQRTLRYLRPTDKLSRPTLPTIMEHGQGTVCARPRMSSTSSQESLASV